MATDDDEEVRPLRSRRSKPKPVKTTFRLSSSLFGKAGVLGGNLISRKFDSATKFLEFVTTNTDEAFAAVGRLSARGSHYEGLASRKRDVLKRNKEKADNLSEEVLALKQQVHIKREQLGVKPQEIRHQGAENRAKETEFYNQQAIHIKKEERSRRDEEIRAETREIRYQAEGPRSKDADIDTVRGQLKLKDEQIENKNRALLEKDSELRIKEDEIQGLQQQLERQKRVNQAQGSLITALQTQGDV